MVWVPQVSDYALRANPTYSNTVPLLGFVDKFLSDYALRANPTYSNTVPLLGFVDKAYPCPSRSG